MKLVASTLCGVALLCRGSKSFSTGKTTSNRKQRAFVRKNSRKVRKQQQQQQTNRKAKVSPVSSSVDGGVGSTTALKASSTAPGDLKPRPGWRRRVLRVFGGGRKKVAPAAVTTTSGIPTMADSPLKMKVTTSSTSSLSLQDQDDDDSTVITTSTYSSDFIRDNFETSFPTTLLPAEEIQQAVSEEEEGSVSLTVEPLIEIMEPAFSPIPSILDGGIDDEMLDERAYLEGTMYEEAYDIDPKRRSALNRVTRVWLESILTGMFDRWSRGEHQNMDVSCDLKGTWRELLGGRLTCDATVDVDSINFNSIRMSGGGRLEARELALNLWSFTPLNQKRKRPRYPNQFDLLAHNVSLTQEDLMQSPCIRNGLRRLLTRILNRQGGMDKAMFVKIDDMVVLKSGKLSLQATATTIFGQRVPFEVRTKLGTLMDGHVLTFPGLELSLSGLFVPIIPEIAVDLGKDAQLLSIEIDPDTGTLNLSARVTITPEHTALFNHTQKAHSRAAEVPARCSVDVGRWLTQLGRFSV